MTTAQSIVNALLSGILGFGGGLMLVILVDAFYGWQIIGPMLRWTAAAWWG